MRPQRILIAEDEVDICRSLAEGFEQRGYDATSCHSGREALELMQGAAFDAVVIDYRMPNGMGDNLIKLLRAARAPDDCPVIVLISGEDPADLPDPFALGVDVFVSKPFTFRFLSGAVQHLLAKRYFERLGRQCAYPFLNDAKRLVERLQAGEGGVSGPLAEEAEALLARWPSVE